MNHTYTKTWIVSFLLLFSVQVQAQVFSIPPSKDALVQINDACPSWQTNNGGAYDFSQIMSWTWFANNCAKGDIRTFMEFDVNGFMSAHPKCFIEKGIMELKFYTGSNQTQSGQNDFTIEMATMAWGEMTIHWNNQPPVTNQAAVNVPPSVQPTQDYQVDISPMVKLWHCGNVPNYGMRMKLNVENTYRRVMMATKEHTDPNLHPQLHLSLACVDLGADVDVCRNQPVQLNGTVQNALNPSQYTYSWTSLPAGFTSSLPAINVLPADTTIYMLQVSNPDGCIIYDTIRVNILPSDSMFIDTSLCAGQVLTIEGLTIAAPGIYKQVYTNGSGCDSIYEITVAPVVPFSVDLGNDTLLCGADQFLLQVNGDFSVIIWQDGTQGEMHWADVSGTYWVNVTDEEGCKGGDTIMVQFMDVPLAMLADTFMCGLSGKLDAGNPGSVYLWNNMATSQEITVTEPGLYSVTVSNACGSIAQTIEVKLSGATEIYIPNVFTPNEDGLNDEFFPVLGETKTYRFTVFNRWGAIIYDAVNPAATWKGVVEHTMNPLPAGVYLYLVSYVNCYEEHEQHIGHITLLR